MSDEKPWPPERYPTPSEWADWILTLSREGLEAEGRRVIQEAEASMRRLVQGDEADFAAVVERVMYEEGWVCNPADHEVLPAPGECINCDGERHRFGYRLFAALSDRSRPGLGTAGVTGAQPDEPVTQAGRPVAGGA